jgi:hypothetical protein
MLNIPQATSISTKDLITSIINDYIIVDYGYVNKVNPDKTVNITHACKPVLLDGTELNETVTKNVEVLTLSMQGFCFDFDIKAGDKVLILGLKDYIDKVAKIEKAEAPTAFIHYSRSCVKVIPLCTITDNAKVIIKVKDGVLSFCGDDNGGLVKAPELAQQLAKLTNRVDTIINALENSATASQDGGAAYKAGIVSILNTIAQKEDFSKIESEKVFHGSGA